ncbi:MAG TPA: hypothetical protein VFK20_10065 [Vicinamibacterales bacterium]|nr:hypothetical protein [Vicinamibacterales bacterium]
MRSHYRLSGVCRAALLTALASFAAPALAQAQTSQSVGFTLGYFALKGIDSRVEGDVLLNDLQSADPLLFEIGDFNGVTFGGEWLFGFGRYLDAGVGLGFYQHTVPSVYAHLQHADGSEIEQDLKLRVIPVTFTARFLPIGRDAVVEPYIGGGFAALKWRYSETGEFVDLNFDIFPARYVAEGTEVAPVFLGGLRVPVGQWAFGGEVRYQGGEGETGGIDEGFLGDKIDLGGWTTNFTLHYRF